MNENESPGFSSKAYWRKLFAVRKFISLANTQSAQEPAQQLIFNKFLVGKKIANGSFGQIRLGLWMKNKESVAIKLEHEQAKIPMLFFEYRFYKTLLNEIGFPKIYHFGTFGKYNALVMELLGPNLEELFIACNRSFSLSTVLQIGIQLVTRMEVIHSHGIIFRDVKPENFLIGHSSHKKNNLINIVDFGLAKEYIDPQTGRHISYTENKFLTGTVRYMSINAHQGKEQSRRDDMEALSHVFFYFLSNGNLPWQGTYCKDIREKYQIIGFIKEETPTIILGKDFPWEFTVFHRYCRSLKFSQSPNYNYLRNLFRNCLKRLSLQEDYVFDWMLPIDGDSQDTGRHGDTIAHRQERQQIGENLSQSKSILDLPKKHSFTQTNNCSKHLNDQATSKISVQSMTYSKARSLPSSINVIIHSESDSTFSKKSKKLTAEGMQKKIKNLFHQINSDITSNSTSSNQDEDAQSRSPSDSNIPIPSIVIEYCTSLVSTITKTPEYEQNQVIQSTTSTLDTLKIVSTSRKPSKQIIVRSKTSSDKGSGVCKADFKQEDDVLEKTVSFFTCCPMTSFW